MSKHKRSLEYKGSYDIPVDNVYVVRPDTIDREVPNLVINPRTNPNYGLFSTGIGYNMYGELVDYNNHRGITEEEAKQRAKTYVKEKVSSRHKAAINDLLNKNNRSRKRIGGNVILGPAPGALEKPMTNEILSYFPFTGSAIDVKKAITNPTTKNIVNAAITAGSDALGSWLLRDVNKAKAAYKTATKAEKTAKEALDTHRANMKSSGVIARSNFDEERRLKEAWEKAYWEKELKGQSSFIQKYLTYPVYGAWLGGDATINYLQNK